MGKNKDSHSAQISPVDSYRKHIGKQDYKKSKGDLKEMKTKAQAKQGISDTYKDISILIGSLIAVMGILYALLYLYLDKKETVIEDLTKDKN